MNAQLIITNPMSVAAQPSVPASFASAAMRSSGMRSSVMGSSGMANASMCSVLVLVAVYPPAAVQAEFAAFAMASIGADAAAPVSGVWGLPCSSLVSSKCTETNKRHNTTNKLATTWQLRPSGVQGDPPV